MAFQEVLLRQFRTYTEAGFQPGPTLNLITGPNGVGKTNILEALHTLALTRGFVADKHMLQHGADHYFVSGRWYQTSGTTYTVSVGWAPRKKKSLLVNGQTLPRLADHIGQIPVVAITPEDLELVQDGHAARRRWLDQTLSQASGAYLQAAQLYRRALDQRNTLLQLAAEQPVPPADFEPWEYQLVQQASIIVRTRQAFISAFRPTFEAIHAELSTENETPSLVFDSSLPPDELPEASKWLRRYADGRKRDLAAGRTLLGPHRDGLDILLRGHSIRQTGSQGQLKTSLLALRLAQYTYLREQLQCPPLLLLDDLFERLDAQRSTALARFVASLQSQTYITDPRPDFLTTRFANLTPTVWTVRKHQILRI